MISLFIAVFMDLIIGDPFGLLHPIVFFGNVITFLESKLYKDSKFRGFIFLLINIAIVITIFAIIRYLVAFNSIIETVVIIYFLYTALASKSLIVESNKVFKPLNENDLNESRKYLSYIVGRDTKELNSTQITKACVETVAENTIDGVIAPIFYITLGIILGYPMEFVFIYKIVNTLDSMIGYKNSKYGKFGFFSAKLDDILNFIPARIGSIVMIFSGALLRLHAKRAFKIFRRDRYNHKSPNSAHPESVIAGLLGVQLGGGNFYFGEFVSKPTIGDDINNILPIDIKRTQKIMVVSTIIFTLLMGVIIYAIKTTWR